MGRWIDLFILYILIRWNNHRRRSSSTLLGVLFFVACETFSQLVALGWHLQKCDIPTRQRESFLILLTVYCQERMVLLEIVER
jgi:hypothetical protein